MKHYKKISIRKKHTKRQSMTKNKSKKQGLWKMKGCANMIGGGCGCTANNMMIGGCGGCNANNMMTGGSPCTGSILAHPSSSYSCIDNLSFHHRNGGSGGNNRKVNGQRTDSESQFIDDNLHNLLLVGGYETCKSDNMLPGATYPNGAIGYPWGSAPLTWPGVGDINGASNHLSQNSYNSQPDRMLMSTTLVPYAYGGNLKKMKKHTFRKHMRKYKNNSYKRNKLTKKNKLYNQHKQQKGGLPSLGILTEIKNEINALRGNPQLVSPLPFNNQLENQYQQEVLNM